MTCAASFGFAAVNSGISNASPVRAVTNRALTCIPEPAGWYSPQRVSSALMYTANWRAMTQSTRSLSDFLISRSFVRSSPRSTGACVAMSSRLFRNRSATSLPKFSFAPPSAFSAGTRTRNRLCA